jgi:diguanylate cyclase (GGDEF)-like protein
MKSKSMFLLTFSLFVLFLISGWDHQAKPHVTKGVLSLEKWDASKDGMITLNGEWSFYWETLDPLEIQSKQSSYIKVPKTWDYDARFPTKGYGMYHLKLTGLKVGEKYGLKIPVQSSAYQLWLDDELLVTVGTPGKSKATTKPGYQTNEILFKAHGETTNLFIAVSNFHYRSGGLWDNLKLGSADEIVKQSKRAIEFEAFVVGSLILSSIYHFVLFLHRRSEWILLIFSSICLAIGVRTLVVSERIIIDFIPNLSWELLIKLEYLMFYLVVPLFSWYFYYLFKAEVSKRICQFMSIISILFVTLVLCTPAVIFTKTLFIYQAFTILAILYAIGVLILAIYRRRPAALIIAIFAAIYIFTVVNDMLYVNGNIRSVNMSGFGLVFFIFSQSYIIAKGVANAFNRAEDYSRELTELNQTLENKIQIRTKSLEESKEELERLNRALTEMSYHDPLTGLANRRLFDDLYDKEWEKSLDNQSFLSIMFMDIDHFKPYNDTYGHQQGDQALVLVASTLKHCIQKYGGTVARIGGEEFIGLVAKQNAEDMLLIAEECRAAVTQLQIPHKGSLIADYVTISIGVTTVIPDEETSKRTLIKNADEALYIAKEGGRNQVVHASS